MSFSERILREDEKAVYTLRELYGAYGYMQYKVSKFEEYDLYARNKNFLVSDNLLTFTDTNGKLMALKPDVTLSIIKNVVANEKATYKVCYDEKVYRTTSSGDGFREIMQTGLETIGNIDSFAQSEVVMLAMKSLENISKDYILDISNMRFLEGLFESTGIDSDCVADMLSLIGSKNIPAIKAFGAKYGISEESIEKICKVASLYMPIKEALTEIYSLVEGDKMKAAYDELNELYSAMCDYQLTEKLYVDFSIVNDMNYYDGIIFKGYINGIYDSVLSGGRYDRLMDKFGKNMQAIGFAVYLDRLERLSTDIKPYDVDVLLVYDADIDAKQIILAVETLKKEGNSVRAVSCPDKSLRYKKLIKLGKDGLESLEEND